MFVSWVYQSINMPITWHWLRVFSCVLCTSLDEDTIKTILCFIPKAVFVYLQRPPWVRGGEWMMSDTVSISLTCVPFLTNQNSWFMQRRCSMSGRTNKSESEQTSYICEEHYRRRCLWPMHQQWNRLFDQRPFRGNITHNYKEIIKKLNTISGGDLFSWF